MHMFDLIFPIFMIGFPAVLALFQRTTESTEQEDTNRLERRLCIATGLGIVLVITVWSLRFIPESSGVLDMLPTMGLESIPTAFLAQVGFFILWFHFAMPLIRAYRPEFEEVVNGQNSKPNQPVRSASLTPRQPPSALHIKSTIWTLGLWLIGFASFLYGWKTYGLPEGKSTSQHLILCGMGLIAALSVALVIPLGHRTMFLSPEPLHAGRSLELEQAYKSKHTCQGRLILGSILLVISLILLIPLSLAFHLRFTGSDWGLIGGLFGTVVGVGGAVVGILISYHRLKIHRIEQGDLERL
ncbi:MAG: hypothetical protein JKY61_07110 [Planctomycetes bacterium]|nr:hypothetical protein [Planctomycetota bacterium]